MPDDTFENNSESSDSEESEAESESNEGGVLGEGQRWEGWVEGSEKWCGG